MAINQSQLLLTAPAIISGCHGNPASLLLGSSFLLMLLVEVTHKDVQLKCEWTMMHHSDDAHTRNPAKSAANMFGFLT